MKLNLTTVEWQIEMVLVWIYNGLNAVLRFVYFRKIYISEGNHYILHICANKKQVAGHSIPQLPTWPLKTFGLL